MIMTIFPRQANSKEINETFISFYNTVNCTATSGNPLLIDYSIEILKYKPNSLESMYVFSLFSRMTLSEKIHDKYIKLKNKYYDDLNNVNSDIPEKLILLLFLIMDVDEKSLNEADNNAITFKKTLNLIKDTCQDNDYSALATILLLFDLKERDNYSSFFKEKYPNHKCLPLVELIMLSDLFSKKDYQKCINECENFIKKYEKIVTPFGWRLIMDCYNLLIFNYLATDDYENAKKYFNLIETEAPNYDNVKQLKQKINKIK